MPRWASILLLYPRWWRERYGSEVVGAFAAASLSARDAADLLRGALDAWLHPPVRSRIPAIAAVTGGAFWTATAIVLAQDPLPDWPGYTMDALPLAIVGAAALIVAIGGAWLRLGDRTSRLERLLGGVAVVAHLAWLVAVVAMLAGGDAAGLTAVTSAAAAIMTGGVALLLARRGDLPLAAALVGAPIALALSATSGWLLFGLAWTAAGLVQWPRPLGRNGPRIAERPTTTVSASRSRAA